jgi:hypothetical protein
MSGYRALAILSRVISQIVTLVGVIVGALASYLATAGAERARHRRMMSTRWDERKLNAINAAGAPMAAFPAARAHTTAVAAVQGAPSGE